MVSLVVATWNRTAELDRLLASLDRQSYGDFEVIVVDQNTDDRLVPVLRRHGNLMIRHLRSALGVSRARNAGLRAAMGQVIAFPDDDCWYPDELLSQVTQWLEQNASYDVLFTATRNQDGKLMAPKLPPRRGPCTKSSIVHCAVAFNAFLRMPVVKAIGGFREDIGPGTPSPYQSGEDLDYMFRPMACGFAAWYDPELTVYHPEFKSMERLRRTTYPYSVGFGYVLRIHNYPLWYVIGLFGRSLAGSLVHLGKGEFGRSYLYLLRAAGQVRGYVFSNPKLSPDQSLS